MDTCEPTFAHPVAETICPTTRHQVEDQGEVSGGPVARLCTSGSQESGLCLPTGVGVPRGLERQRPASLTAQEALTLQEGGSLREDSPEAHLWPQQEAPSVTSGFPTSSPSRPRAHQRTPMSPGSHRGALSPASTGAEPPFPPGSTSSRPVCQPSRGWVLPVTNGKRIRKYWTRPWPGRDPQFPGSPLRFLSRLWN